MVWLLGCVLLVAGLVVWGIGRWGRRVDLHLICRACGFDLFNRPEGAVRCPECGADTRRRRSMRVGNRRAMVAVAAAGMAVTAAGAALVTIGVAQWAARADWIGWTPMAVLRGEMMSPAARTRQRACGEILRRIREHRGSDGEVSAVVEALLARQAAGAGVGPWQPVWGDIVQAAILEGRASAAQAERYVQQTVVVTFEARPRVREGDPLPLSVTCGFHGGSDLGPLAGAEVRARLRVSLQGGGEWPVELRSQTLDSVVPIPVTFAAAIMPGSRAMPAGAHLVHMACELRIVPQRAGMGTMAVERNVELGVQVVGEKEASVELVENRQAEAAMAAAVRVVPSAERQGGNLGWLTTADPPLPVAFEVVVEQEGRTWVAGRFLARPNGYARVPLAVAGGLSLPHAGHAELVLRPDPELARGTTDVMGVWSGTVRVGIELP